MLIILTFQTTVLSETVNNEPLPTKQTRASIDTDGDGWTDDVDILDNGNGIIVLSVDYFYSYDSGGLDDSYTNVDPKFSFWLDLNNNNLEDFDEYWTRACFEDTREIFDKGFFGDTNGYHDDDDVWFAVDVPDNIQKIKYEMTVMDADWINEDDWIDINGEEIDWSSYEDWYYPNINPIYYIESDGMDDSGSDKIDAFINISLSVQKGTTIDSSNPAIDFTYNNDDIIFNSKVNMDEGTSTIFSISVTEKITDDETQYEWYLYSEKDDEWITINSTTNYFDLYGNYHSSGTYYIAAVAYTGDKIELFGEENEDGNPIVTDTFFFGWWEVRYWQLEINHINTIPKASFQLPSNNVEQLQDFKLSARDSFDLDGDELTYKWDFGDGSTAEGLDVSHYYLNPGNYDVSLTVIDDEDAFDIQKRTITALPLDVSDITSKTILTENSEYMNFSTDYENLMQNIRSNSIRVKLPNGESLEFSASLILNLRSVHTGELSYKIISQDDNGDNTKLKLQLENKEDYYQIFFKPEIGMEINYVHQDGSKDNLWNEYFPVPLILSKSQELIEELDEDGEPFASIPVKGMGSDIDIYTWDNEKNLYEGDGSDDIALVQIPVAEVDLLELIEALATYAGLPALGTAIDIVQYFIEVYLEMNVNVDVNIEDQFGLLINTNETIYNNETYFQFYSLTDINEITIDGVKSTNNLFSVSKSNMNSSISISLDLYFDLTETGKYIWGYAQEIKEKGLIIGFMRATKDYLTGKEPEFEAVRITLWDSGTLVFMTLSKTNLDLKYYIYNFDGDTDNDGYFNIQDEFPDDPAEWIDSDGDGVGDNSDAFPNDKTETIDTDKDGVGDNSDVFPNDNTETIDTDEDGIGDNKDAFPNDKSETQDTDKDGVGDNSDIFPTDKTESIDTDGDGVGDNKDVFPKDPDEWKDTDGDGIGDRSDIAATIDNTSLYLIIATVVIILIILILLSFFRSKKKKRQMVSQQSFKRPPQTHGTSERHISDDPIHDFKVPYHKKHFDARHQSPFPPSKQQNSPDYVQKPINNEKQIHREYDEEVIEENKLKEEIENEILEQPEKDNNEMPKHSEEEFEEDEELDFEEEFEFEEDEELEIEEERLEIIKDLDIEDGGKKQFQEPYKNKVVEKIQHRPLYPCHYCNTPLVFVEQYGRWYCNYCRQYK